MAATPLIGSHPEDDPGHPAEEAPDTFSPPVEQKDLSPSNHQNSFV